MYLQSLHFTSLYLPAYLCRKLRRTREVKFHQNDRNSEYENETFVSQKRTGKRFFFKHMIQTNLMSMVRQNILFDHFFTVYEIVWIKIVKIFWKHFISIKTSISCTFIRCHWSLWSSILVFKWTGCFGASNRLSFPVARNFCSVFILVKHQSIDNFMLHSASK